MDEQLKPAYSKTFAFILGFVSLISQIIIIREFLAVFNGNELVIGVVLANWMLITAIGSYLGKYAKPKNNYLNLFITFIILIAVLPIITIFLISYLKNFIFTVGAMLSIFDVQIYSFLLLIPFCLTSGLVFTILSAYYSENEKKNKIANIYAIESFGSITGGLISGFALIYLFSGIKSLLIISVLSFSVIFYIALKEKLIIYRNISAFLLIIFFALLFTKIDVFYRTFNYINQKIEHIKDTPFGNIVITKRAGQTNVYNNGNLIFDTENTINNEESIHYSMVQVKNPDNVLLISGGLTGMLNEILKYNIKQVDYVEFNKWLYDLLKDSVTELNDKRINTYINDPVNFIKKTTIKYDAIIINIPDPENIELNRYYTLEFFELIRNVLSERGVVSFKLLSSMNYMSDEALKISSSVYYTLGNVFENVILIPGENNYYIASNAELSLNICSLISNSGIENEYVNQYYIDDNLLKKRSKLLTNSFDRNVEFNVDFKPVIYFNQIKLWLQYFPGKFWLSCVLILLIIVFFIIKSNHLTLAMFAAGFSGSALEILLLFGLQILFGNIYQFTALIFAIFMLGLTIGAKCSNRVFKYSKLSLRLIHFMIALKAIIAALLLFVLHHFEISQFIVYTLISVLTGLIGFAVGTEFLLISNLLKGKYISISGNTYSFDLIGAALGAIITSIYLIPALGTLNTGIVIGLLNILIVLYITLYKKL